MLLQLTSGKYFNLNEVGGYVWELLDEPRTVAQLAQEIATEYEVSEEQTLPDVTALLVDLLAAEFVEIGTAEEARPLDPAGGADSGPAE